MAIAGAIGAATGADASKAGPTVTPSNGGSTAAGSVSVPPTTAAATAAELALAASATQFTQNSTASSASGTSSDSARTDPLGSDSAQALGALLFTNAPPVHLAASSHTGAQQATGVLQSPLGTSAWVEELGAQLSWMANRGIDTASLHVSPAELGPIEVRIAVHGSDASVWFGASQAATRAALEQALPQLHQLLASHGLALADAGVFREPPRGSARQAPTRSVAPAAAVNDEPARASDARTAARLGLLDLYA